MAVFRIWRAPEQPLGSQKDDLVCHEMLRENILYGMTQIQRKWGKNPKNDEKPEK